MNSLSWFFLWLMSLAGSQGQQTRLLTDFPDYSKLAPCATAAVTDCIYDLSYDCQNIGTATVQASCACLKNRNSYSISSHLTGAVIYYCGSTATDDVTSVLAAFSRYCAMARPITTKAPSPESLIVLTDFPAYSLLAPCATKAFQDRLDDLSYDCQNIATPAVQASCACLKNQNSESFSDNLSGAVTYYCGSTATDDVTSALDVFSSYCAMAAPITTKAPLPTAIVFLTDFPAYGLLAPCATEAFRDRLNDLSGDCQEIATPTGQASCACVKNQNSQSFSDNLYGAATYYCGTTAKDDAASALDVFSSYCAQYLADTGSSPSSGVSSPQIVPSTPSASSMLTSSAQAAPSAQPSAAPSTFSYVASTPSTISDSATSTSLSNSGGNSGGQGSGLSTKDQVIIGVVIPVIGIIVAIVIAICKR